MTAELTLGTRSPAEAGLDPWRVWSEGMRAAFLLGLREVRTSLRTPGITANTLAQRSAAKWIPSSNAPWDSLCSPLNEKLHRTAIAPVASRLAIPSSTASAR